MAHSQLENCGAACLFLGLAACTSSTYRMPIITDDGGRIDALSSSNAPDAQDGSGQSSLSDHDSGQDSHLSHAWDAQTDSDVGGIPDAAADAVAALEPVLVSCALPSPPPLELAPGDSSDAVFARGALPVFEIEISGEEWEAFCANAVDMAQTGGSLYAEATLTISGEPMEASVGFRARGESNLEAIFGRPGAYEECLEWRFERKPSFKIKFARGASWRGLRHINLVGPEGGPPLLEEYVFSAIAARLSLPAPRVNHGILCVNGEYRGVFSIQEEADDQAFLNQHFADDPNGLYYKTGHGGHLHFPNGSPASFMDHHEPVASTAPDMAALIEFLHFVNFDPDFADEIESWIDIDNWLGITALEMALLDADGAYNRGANFLLYRDTAGKWFIIRYDTDMILRDEDIDGWNDTEQGSRLFCYYHWRARSRNNPDGTAPMRTPEFTVPEVQFSVLQARLLFGGSHAAAYLEWIARVLDEMVVVDSLLDERVEFLSPWIAFDPFAGGVSAWRASVESLRAGLRRQLETAQAQYDLFAGMEDGIFCP